MQNTRGTGTVQLHNRFCFYTVIKHIYIKHNTEDKIQWACRGSLIYSVCVYMHRVHGSLIARAFPLVYSFSELIFTLQDNPLLKHVGSCSSYYGSSEEGLAPHCYSYLKLSVLHYPSTLLVPAPTANIIGQNQCWVYNNNNWGEWVLKEGIRGWGAGRAGLTAGGGEVIASEVVEVPTQATGGTLVLLAHLQVDTRASIPGQGEAKRTLHQQVIGQPLNKHTSDSLRQT